MGSACNILALRDMRAASYDSEVSGDISCLSIGPFVGEASVPIYRMTSAYRTGATRSYTLVHLPI